MKNVESAARATDDVPTQARTRTPLWLAVPIAVVFGALYAYDLWEAIDNLVGMGLYAQGLGVALTGFGWALLIVGLVVPLGVFVAAFWLARLRSPLAQLAIFATGYCVIQVLSSDIAALVAVGGLNLG